MKRLILAAFVLGISLGLGQTADAATAYNFFDLSAGIPHKSGGAFDGMWNDGQSWFVTNGADALLVNGLTYETKNVSPSLRYLGMGQVTAAAGDGSRWLIVGLAGTNEYMYSALPDKKAVFVEFSPSGIRRVDLSPYIPDKSYSIVLFGLRGRIFVLFPGYAPNPSRLFTYADGKLEAYPIAEGAFGGYGYHYVYDRGNVIQFQIENDAIRWHSFDGRTWIDIQNPEATDTDSALRYIRARGSLVRSWGDERYIRYAYPLDGSRDRFSLASRRPDGVTLLGGYGTNGLRLVLLTPIKDPYADEDELGSVSLTATPVPGTTSQYDLRAEAQGDVTYVRLLKDGSGFKKCAGRVCTARVDVRGTADRFEAYGQWRNGELGRPLTSKALVLRDTAAVQEIRPWFGAYGSQEAKSTVQPDSLNPTILEKTAWHLDFSHFLVLSNHSKCEIKAGKTVCSYPSDAKTLNQAAADWGKAKAEIFVEGRNLATCKAEGTGQDLLAKWTALHLKAQYISANLTVRHCAVSLDKTDVPGGLTYYGHMSGPYVSYPNPAQIRVFAKISWREKGRTIMTISPTDTVTYQ